LLVSVIIPCYNESQFIEACIRSVLAFELPDDVGIEILVIDGRSTDDTREIVSRLAQHEGRIRLLDNPGRIQACALNIGFREARGQWVLRLDAHSTYPPDYLRLCLETAQRTGADNVGGLFITQQRGSGYEAALVQALTTHPFGVGDSGFRTGAAEGPADTVPYGFYRRDVVQRIGWFDERLVRAQDYEFNRRLIAAGGKIWRNPAIQVQYYNQPTLKAFYKKQVLLEAPYNAYMWYLAPYAFAPRHAITGVFALGVLGGVLLSPFSHLIAWPFAAVMALYAILAVASAVQQAVRSKRPLHVLALPPCFFLYHFLHGIGVLWGILRLLTGTAPVQKIAEPWPGAGRKRAWAK
jgi:glycosyltransferase involved in cell wall biosynthesis